MSEVIEGYIRRNPQLAQEAEAFDAFLQNDRIRAWVAADPSRRDRLRAEFSRVWADLHPAGAGPQQLEQVRVRAVAAPPEMRAPPRRLQVLCARCSRMDVWSADGRIACRRCGHEYDDMLGLVPAKLVGPFSYVFGDGASGWLVAGGLAAGLAALYLVLRWMRWG